MKKTIALVIISAGAIVLGGCSLYGSNSTPSSTMSNNMQSSSSQTPPVSANAVIIQNFAFNPGTLTVKKGATVTWTNNDSAAHQIKSMNFNSGLLNKGQTFSFTFNDTGTFDYSCAIHPTMLGKIIVQ